MLKGAIAHNGTVLLDVISPCVTFNDHEGSTKSYKYMQEHEEAISEVGFVPHFEEIDVEYDPGTTYDVQMHDGSHLRLRKLHDDYNPSDRISAVKALMEAHARGDVLTGVFYVDTKKPSFTEMLNLVDEPLGTLPETVTRPGREVLDKVMESLR
jgi:2-oxoglutarate ferredoxin oxidoreductase subunit beta